MTWRIALTRPISDSINHCQLTHLERTPIDLARAREQHRQYELCLERLGCTIMQLPAQHDLPDAVFVEDTAVVLDEIAIIARPGTRSRRTETFTVMVALSRFRPLALVGPPGTLDGGDVLPVGRTLYVGRSTRTDARAIARLERIVAPYAYTVRAVDVGHCLHLKSAATVVADSTVLLNPDWVDGDAFAAFERIETDPAEPFAANALRIADTLLYADHFPRTRARLEAYGLRVLTVQADELAKAEGGVTCGSLIFRGDGGIERRSG